jgi:uncharacterized YigZ family protein
MEDRYVTLGGCGFSEYEDRKSRFLGYAAHVATEKEAIDFVSSIRKKHSDARHNVYAYVIKDGNYVRYSDDGEPQGTAGMPVLDVIRKSGFTDAVIVVTRYFGGILLGTGGLVHAYTEAASLAVKDAEIVEYEPFGEVLLSTDYSTWQKMSHMFSSMPLIVDSINYGADVEVRVAVPIGYVDKLLGLVTELSSGRDCGILVGKRYDRIKSGSGGRQ